MRNTPFAHLNCLARDDTGIEPAIEPDGLGRLNVCDHGWDMPASRAPTMEIELRELQSKLDSGTVHRTRVVSSLVLSNLDGNAPYVGFPLATMPSCGGGAAIRLPLQLGA